MESMAGDPSKLPPRSVVVTDDRKTRNKKFFSSVHKVLSDDDLLMEILLLLPILSLHLFRCVSKQWRSLITSPNFTLRRSRIPNFDPPSGLLLPSTGLIEYDFVSFDPRISSKSPVVFSFNSKKRTKIMIEQSCNGLLLCFIWGDEYYVFNPSISMFKIVPPIHNLNYYIMRPQDMRIAFDPQSPHYKVVHVGGVKNDDDEFGYSIRIQTYSSKTGIWSVWDDQFPGASFECFCDGLYWNGAINWLSDYDNEPFYCKLEIMDRPVLTKIQTPLTVEGELYCDHKLFGSCGNLLLLCKDYYNSRDLEIYEMKSGSSEWSVKYFVNLDDMMRPFPAWRMPANWCCSHIRSIVLREREKDSFMVIELFGKMLRYQFGLETVSELFDLGTLFSRSDCFEFISSFAHM